MFIPRTTFHGYLKRITPEILSPLGHKVLTAAYPGFWDDPKNVRKMEGWRDGAPYEAVFAQPRPARRYAGDILFSKLDRGRYSTVANDASGHDAGTLVNELSAYADPMRAGVVMARDLAVPELLADFREFLPDTEPERALVISFFAWTDAPSPFVEQLDQQTRSSIRTVRGDDGWTIFPIKLPYLVDEVEIPDVLDMRLLETQRWLAEQWLPGAMNFIPPLDREIIFPELLPGLIWPSPGGSGLTETLGLFCQLNGISGIVFPSARSDAAALQRDGELAISMGFNFVDLRGIETTFTAPGKMTGSLPTEVMPGVKITHGDEGEWAGSWKVEGVVKAHGERLTRGEQAFLDHARSRATPAATEAVKSEPAKPDRMLEHPGPQPPMYHHLLVKVRRTRQFPSDPQERRKLLGVLDYAVRAFDYEYRTSNNTFTPTKSDIEDVTALRDELRSLCEADEKSARALPSQEADRLSQTEQSSVPPAAALACIVAVIAVVLYFLLMR